MKAHFCAAAAFAGTWLSMVRLLSDALRSIAAAKASRAAAFTTWNAPAVFVLGVQALERSQGAHVPLASAVGIVTECRVSQVGQ